MPATRRRLLTASIGLATFGIRPTGGISPARAARRSLTFAGYGGLFQEIYEAAIIEPFRRAHPEFDVIYYNVPGSAETLAALRRQRDAPEIDVALLDLAAARTAAAEGLLENLPPASIPVLAELAPAATFTGIPGRALFTEPLVLLYDAARVRPPKTWKILWSVLDERSIALPAPPDSIGIAFTVVAGRLFGGGDEQHAIGDGVVAIGELQRRVTTWNPSPEVYDFVGGGDAKLGVGWNMSAQVIADRTGGRLGVSFPDEGTLSRVTTVNLVRNTGQGSAGQADAARQLIAWVLGSDAQKTMVEKMYLGPVNARARYVEGALQRTANTAERAARAMPVDWVLVGAMRDGILRRWHEVIPEAV